MGSKDNTPSNTRASSGQSEVADKSAIKSQPKNSPCRQKSFDPKVAPEAIFYSVSPSYFFQFLVHRRVRFIYQLQQQQAEIQTTLRNNQIYIEGLRGEIKDEQRKHQDKSHSGLPVLLTDIESQLAAYARRLSEASFAPRYMGLLAEAEHLTRLASHRLATEKNSKNAIRIASFSRSCLKGFGEAWV